MPPPVRLFPLSSSRYRKMEAEAAFPSRDSSLYGHTGSIKGCFGLRFPLSDELKHAASLSVSTNVLEHPSQSHQ